MGCESFIQSFINDGAAVGGATVTYCIPTIPADTASFTTMTKGACSSSNQSQYVDPRLLFQRQVVVSLKANGALTDALVTVTTQWYEGSILKQSQIVEKYEDSAVWETTPATVFQPAP